MSLQNVLIPGKNELIISGRKSNYPAPDIVITLSPPSATRLTNGPERVTESHAPAPEDAQRIYPSCYGKVSDYLY